MEAALVGHLALDLNESQGLSRPASRSKRVGNRKQKTRVGPQGAPGVALIRKMRQEGNTLFQQGT